MTLHLAEIGRNAHAVVTLDGAGWHRQGGRLEVPGNVSLLVLPPYSPALNPQENVWQYLRQNYLANRVLATYDASVDACCHAWDSLAAMPGRITSITTEAGRNKSWFNAVGMSCQNEPFGQPLGA